VKTTMKQLPQARMHQRQRGLSLIELLVSLVIGGLVLAAVLLTVSGTGLSGRRQDAGGRLNDEGQLALNLLAMHLRMAGSIVPRQAFAGRDNDWSPPRAMLPFGCRNGFTDATLPFDNLVCAGAGGNDAIAVRYELDADSSPALVGGVPIDCLGQQIAAAEQRLIAGVGLVWVSDNRFFIANNPNTGNPALFCRGNGGGAANVLVDNIETMRIRYGLLAPDGRTYAKADRAGWEIAYTDSVSQYVDANAAELTAPPAGVAARDLWRRVGVMNLCIVVRSADNMVDEPTSFLDCEGMITAAADRRLRRAMYMTIAVRNSGAPGTPLPP
jgi:type IV pilus assembly protein PilW